MEKMYYDRVISANLQNLISQGGKLRWLYEFVLNHHDLDFLIGKNKKHNWISVYYGLSRIIRIISKSKDSIKIDAEKIYEKIANENHLNIYGTHKIDSVINFSVDLQKLLNLVMTNKRFHKNYYSKKEGYYQTMFSREYGLNATGSEEFVIIDKESVIGYENKNVKNSILNPFRNKYRNIYSELSNLNSKRYGKDRTRKSIGNELDFLATNSNGDLFLIEFKHGSSTPGIYLSPIQIGLYYDIISNYIEQHRDNFEKIVKQIIEQKKQIGLLPRSFKCPEKINNIIPVLVIAEYNSRSSAITKYKEILKISRDILGNPSFLSNIRIFSYDENGLKALTI